MGALTSKKQEFAYRNWEQKTFTEIDETEVLYSASNRKIKN